MKAIVVEACLGCPKFIRCLFPEHGQVGVSVHCLLPDLPEKEFETTELGGKSLTGKYLSDCVSFVERLRK
jgi:hypothetical protein